MFVSSFVLWVDVLSTKYLFFSMCSLNSKRCIISMCSTNQRVRVRVLPSDPAEWIMGFICLVRSCLLIIYADLIFKTIEKLPFIWGFILWVQKNSLNTLNSNPLCCLCSVVRFSAPSQSERSFQGRSTSRSQHCFVLKPYFPHAWCEIFEMFFKSTTWKPVM